MSKKYYKVVTIHDKRWNVARFHLAEINEHNPVCGVKPTYDINWAVKLFDEGIDSRICKRCEAFRVMEELAS